MLTLLTLWACNFDAGRTYPVTGTVLEVHERSLLVDHDEIVGVMKPMAMSFETEPSLTRKVTPGDQIRALLLVNGPSYRLTGVEVTGHTDLATRADSPQPLPLQVGDTLAARQVETTIGPVTVGAGQGAPTVLTYLFTTCPNPEYCPALATRLAALQPLLPDTARILAITLDPDTDTLPVLEAWGAGFGARPPGWIFGRLPLEQLGPLLHLSGVNRLSDRGPLTHNLVLLALDADGVVRLRAPDNGWDPAAVAAALGAPPRRSD